MILMGVFWSGVFPAVNILLKSMGLPHGNVTMCDTKGVIYQGRTEGMNQWKSAHAAKTDARTLAEAMDGADIVLGLDSKAEMMQAWRVALEGAQRLHSFEQALHGRTLPKAPAGGMI